MDTSGWAVLAISVPIIVALIGAWVKTRTEAAGYKLSYEREKQRADEQDQIVRDRALATDIANKFAETLQRMASESKKVGP